MMENLFHDTFLMVKEIGSDFDETIFLWQDTISYIQLYTNTSTPHSLVWLIKREKKRADICFLNGIYRHEFRDMIQRNEAVKRKTKIPKTRTRNAPILSESANGANTDI